MHKHRPAEVLLTGLRRRGSDDFTVTARWPDAHVFYERRLGAFDPLLFAETVRQSIPFLSHVAYDVPLGHQLIWEYFTYSVNPAALRIQHRPAVVELHITCSDVVRRAARMAAITMDVTAFAHGRELGSARARFTSNPPALYKRLRAGYADPLTSMAAARPAPPPIPAAAVGRLRQADVVLSATDAPSRWLLRSDTSHPVLFDHPVDHVPGMLLLEGARQAALARVGARDALPVAFDSTFFQYVEFDAPCRIAAEPTLPDHRGRPRVDVVALQRGGIAFSCIVTLEPRGAGPYGTAPAAV
ncbi:ScbA/BarX family gamma-butyrolactone biosynthesis protein [Streptomyces sp. NPDC006326]|uniref:ScbA/BarX family gamma-butyrolactone biosynthesis protein n=1 Tax=Streptomyces sp. NPDC006326 TaxID=3156752 RepID=UPI0033A2BCE6